MSTLPAYVVWFRGHPACPCQAQWLPVLEAEAQCRGILRGTLPISQLIGGAAASGNTHIDGGAADFYPLTAILDVVAFVELAREMGADATFERLENWDGDGGVHHVHSVLRGCEHNGPARYQITAVDAGFNGLGYLGQAAPDAGPRPLSGRTWRQGIEWARQQEDDMGFTDWPQKDQDALVNAVAAAVTKRLLDTDLTPKQDEPKSSVRAALNKVLKLGDVDKAARRP